MSESKQQEATPKKYILGYWAIRGLANPIRMMLEWAGADWEDELYVQGDGPEFSREEWNSVKYKQGLDFTNLPYLKHGDVRLTQSNAIARYVARSLGKGLYPSEASVAELGYVDMLTEVAMDLRNDIIRCCYGRKEEYPARLQRFQARFPPVLAQLVAYKNKHVTQGPWLVGKDGKLSFVDFILWELLDQIRIMWPDAWSKDDKVVVDFMAAFESQPAIAAYLKSDRAIKPANNKTAAFI
eukprot:TRINITY_DN68190_c2_g1_i1.p1 TRINITY_DN68190_c2_g1~~TRINITY_DN68190_c2_g1_i1.p1  ORF type:complete len:240 (+),score=115.38 TRINITY_DN68190_c2_g1_i1:51-770(+)